MKIRILYVIVGLLLLFMAFQCNRNNDLQTDAKRLNIEADTDRKIAEIYIQENIKLNDREVKYSDSIQSLKNELELSKSKLEIISKNTENIISKIRSHKTTDNTKFIADRYNAPNDVKSAENSTIIKDNVTKKVIIELVEKDGLQEKQKIYTNDIEKLKETGVYKDTVINIEKLKNNNLMIGIDKLNSSLDKKEEAIKGIEKQVKTEKNKKNIWKTLFYGLLTYLGINLIYK